MFPEATLGPPTGIRTATEEWNASILWLFLLTSAPGYNFTTQTLSNPVGLHLLGRKSGGICFILKLWKSSPKLYFLQENSCTQYRDASQPWVLPENPYLTAVTVKLRFLSLRFVSSVAVVALCCLGFGFSLKPKLACNSTFFSQPPEGWATGVRNHTQTISF